MALRTILQLKAWFKTGLKPAQSQFWDWMESYWHKNEKIPADSVENLIDLLNGKYPDNLGKENAKKIEQINQSVTEIKQTILNNSVTVDGELSTTSTNPVQNKVIAAALPKVYVQTTEPTDAKEGDFWVL